MSDFDTIVSSELTDDQRSLLCNLLAKLACADGHIDPFESQFLQSFLGDRLGTDLKKGLQDLPALSDEDIATRGKANPEPIYLLCSLLTCVDEHVDDKELELLGRYATNLGLTQGRMAELDSIARRQILDESAQAMAKLQGFPEEKAKALAQLAERLRATPAELEETQTRYEFIAK